MLERLPQELFWLVLVAGGPEVVALLAQTCRPQSTPEGSTVDFRALWVHFANVLRQRHSYLTMRAIHDNEGGCQHYKWVRSRVQRDGYFSKVARAADGELILQLCGARDIM